MNYFVTCTKLLAALCFDTAVNVRRGAGRRNRKTSAVNNRSNYLFAGCAMRRELH